MTNLPLPEMLKITANDIAKKCHRFNEVTALRDNAKTEYERDYYHRLLVRLMEGFEQLAQEYLNQ